MKEVEKVEVMKVEISNGGEPPPPPLPTSPAPSPLLKQQQPSSTNEKKQDVFIQIKKEYLPAPPKATKTREDVTRVLFDNGPSTNGNDVVIKQEIVEIVNNKKEIIQPKEEPEMSIIKKEEEVPVSVSLPPPPPPAPAPQIKVEKVEVKNESKSDSHRNSKSSSSSSSHRRHHQSSDSKDSKRHHSSSSSSSKNHESKSSTSSKENGHRSSHSGSKSGSSNSHRSSSSKDCSRCYRRSKIKRANIGIQCRRDKVELATIQHSHRKFEFKTNITTPIPIANRDFNCQTVQIEGLKYERFFRVEVHPNGGASVVHMYQDEIDSLKPDEMAELVQEFFKVVFQEDENGCAYHVMGIVHNAAAYLPDLLDHMAEMYPDLTVKAGVLGNLKEIETCTMHQYYEQVVKNYQDGTIRYGPLHQISLVGKVHEEVGGYFPDLLARIEANPFLNQVSQILLFSILF